MRLVLSPYDLAADSPAGAAAMLIASDPQDESGRDGGVRTLLPTPFSPANSHETGLPSPVEQARDAAERAPSFGRLVESLAWSSPLWRCGLISASRSGSMLAAGLEASAAELAATPAFARCAEMFPLELFKDEAAFLEALSRDILRGGVHPGLHLPIERLAESVAAEENAVIVSAQPVRRGERRPAWDESPSQTITIPVVLPQRADIVLRLRDDLCGELDLLRSAVAECVFGRTPTASARGRCLNAADALHRAFRERERGQAGVNGPAVLLVSIEHALEGAASDAAVDSLHRFTGPPAGTRGHGEAPSVLSARPRLVPRLFVKRTAWDTVA